MVGKGEVALIVLSYLKEEGFDATFKQFTEESKPVLEANNLSPSVCQPIHTLFPILIQSIKLYRVTP